MVAVEDIITEEFDDWFFLSSEQTSEVIAWQLLLTEELDEVFALLNIAEYCSPPSFLYRSC